MAPTRRSASYSGDIISVSSLYALSSAKGGEKRREISRVGDTRLLRYSFLPSDPVDSIMVDWDSARKLMSQIDGEYRKILKTEPANTETTGVFQWLAMDLGLGPIPLHVIDSSTPVYWSIDKEQLGPWFSGPPMACYEFHRASLAHDLKTGEEAFNAVEEAPVLNAAVALLDWAYEISMLNFSSQPTLGDTEIRRTLFQQIGLYAIAEGDAPRLTGKTLNTRLVEYLDASFDGIQGSLLAEGYSEKEATLNRKIAELTARSFMAAKRQGASTADITNFIMGRPIMDWTDIASVQRW